MFKNFFTRVLILLFSLWVIPFKILSQENYPIGGRSIALSNATVSTSDCWSTFNNQSGLPYLPGTTVGIFYESRYGIDLLSLSAISLILPYGKGAFGLSFYQFGKNNFKEHKYGLAYALRLFKKWSAAIQLDYLSKHFPENKHSKGASTFELGLLFAPTKNLKIGAHIFNPISQKIKSSLYCLKIPIIFRLGGHYHFNDFVLVAFEGEKEEKNPILIKAGLEFKPIKNLFIRFGTSGKPFKYSGGIGYITHKLSLDIGFSYHGNLGFSPSASIQYSL